MLHGFCSTTQLFEVICLLLLCLALQQMTVSDIILEAAKRLGIDTSHGLVSPVSTNSK